MVQKLRPEEQALLDQQNSDTELDPELNVLKIMALEQKERNERRIDHRMAEAITSAAGSSGFVLFHVVWFTLWIVYNAALPFPPFDPFPFTFLTLVVSLEAIFLSTFILISQNSETRLTERRNHLDLQINLLSEQENTKMLELLKSIAEKVGVDCDDPHMEAMLEPVEPEMIVERLAQAADEDLQELTEETTK